MTDETPRLSIFYQLFVASRLGSAITESALDGTGVDGSEYALLSVLFVGGPAPVGRIALETGTPLATTSRHLKQLARDGVVLRRKDPDDARKVVYTLSRRGLARFRASQVPFTDMHNGVIESLGDDVELVSWALARLDHAIRDAAGGVLAGAVPDPPGVELSSLRYTGPPLPPRVEAHVLQYLDWIRDRSLVWGD